MDGLQKLYTMGTKAHKILRKVVVGVVSES